MDKDREKIKILNPKTGFLLRKSQSALFSALRNGKYEDQTAVFYSFFSAIRTMLSTDAEESSAATNATAFSAEAR